MIEHRKLTVTLETVTPMFLAGANQKVPELRAPSFMGALRYWTRAALGGVLGDRNIEDLKKAEEAVWGSTNGTGAVRIQLIAEQFTAEELKALPHKPESDKASRTKFYAVPAETKFQIVLRQHVPSTETWDMAIASLLLMTVHGGVGKRARRGWGTLVIKEFAPQDGLPEFARTSADLLSNQGMSIGDWYEYRKWVVGYSIRISMKLVEQLDLPRERPHRFPTSFPILSNKPSQMTNVLVKKAYASFDEAIIAFG
jgi:CRISPR type III-B/RAMP module RAMP protein Cmr1